MIAEDVIGQDSRQVERAVETGSALVVVVTSETAFGPHHDRALSRVADLLAAGFEVVHLLWSADHPEDSYRALDEITTRSAARTVASVIDIDLPALDAAHHAAELAWHAGFTVVLRLGEKTRGSLAGQPDASAAVAQADVVVADQEVQRELRGISRDVLATAVEQFSASDLVAALGPVEPPASAPSMTVLVTTYARRDELAACLGSLTTQTLSAEHFDVVVVDDASPEDVAPVVKRFEGRLRTTLIRLPVNSGPAAARAAGVRAATGDVVMLLDDDDVLAPRALAEHLRVHLAHPEEHVAALGHTVVRPSGAPTLLSRHVTRTGHQYFDYGRLRTGTVLGWAGFWAGRVSAKRTLLVRHSFRGTFMEDTDFAWRADEELSRGGTPLEIHYAREAVQIMSSPLDLEGMRRRQVRMGWAAHGFQALAGLPWQAQHQEFVAALKMRPGLSVHLLDELPQRSAEKLADRRTATTSAASSAGLRRIDGLLKLDLTAHEGSGFLASAHAADLRRSGRTPVLAVDGLDLGAVQAAARTQAGDALRLVVVLPDHSGAVGRFITDLTAVLRQSGRSLEGLGDVELRPQGDLADALDAVDFVVDPHGRLPYSEGRALPLLALSAAEWTEQLARPGSTAGSLR